ncbi:MAG: IS21 family transposase [Phycisphaerae bacterium]|nr:IS21 family transposase [Planctomycetia bacterium]MCL4718777.1 IS21 family transposase [Phycisphaerae bacterium]
MDDYGQIRRAHRDGLSIRAIARTLHHSRRKVRDALTCPQPQTYARRKDVPAPKLGPFKPLIDEILGADEAAPRKQRHTAAQIFRRLRDEHGYAGRYDQVRRYVGVKRRDRRETFIPLSHDPGQRLECDFGHIGVDYPEGRRFVPVLMAAWSYSNAPFAKAMPTQRTEAILSGMVEALEFFDCVPHEVWWDNPTTVAAQILKGRERRPNPHYAALASHYAFEPLFCLPACGNEKPYVEHRVYDLQRRFATPVPKVKDSAELNARLRDWCLKERDRTCAGQTETIAPRFERDRAAASPLPACRFDPCLHQAGVVDKYQTVRFDGNRYSVPRSCAFRTVTVKAYVEEIHIVANGRVVARHPRSYEPGRQLLDPLHYLVTLGRRPAALDHSGVYRDWHLPPEFASLRKALEARHGAAAGARQYIRVLQLLAQHPVERVAAAIVFCGQALSADRILQHVFRRAQREANTSPPLEGLDLDDPALTVRVPPPDLNRFDQLLSADEPRSSGEPAYA